MILEQEPADGYDHLAGNIEEARRKLAEGKIMLGFNGFLELPLGKPIFAPGFINCPAGIAVTDTRLWIVHLPFADNPMQRQIKLWSQFGQLEFKPPRYAIAFGGNGLRLFRLMDEMKKATGVEEVDGSAMISEVDDLYELHINQKGNRLSIGFQETAYPENVLDVDLEL
ncbi:MAG: hypothetical protein A3C22_02460 [Candidatus Levybacteria bacterium RIFCSPHIGHO2_02_FULL_37_10]|nr:MAG: hypothetical protein A3C22_02460 [Candidatus Levybacteria bacterium RIFCSPHIGHO2_02_FULL_37_10]